jgi:hypothetical protein
MKIKVLKANNSVLHLNETWWYNKHIGEEFEVHSFSYYKSGANHPLDIKDKLQIPEFVKKYGYVNIHVIWENSSYHYPQLLLEDSNFSLDIIKKEIRKEKLQRLKTI